MKKVVVMGYIGIRNYGDNFLADCVSHIVEKNEGFEATEADLEPKMNLFTKFFYYAFMTLSKLIKHNKFSSRCVLAAAWLRCHSYYKKVLKDTDALIFAGGSFKYGTQKVWAYYSLATKIAKKYGISVMYNAMNVQKYSDTDWKCNYLRTYANSDNVKCITTRDGEFGVDRLVKDYKIRDGITCAGVGDPAFWIPDCYGISRDLTSETVGINIIWGKAFKSYGKSFSEEQLLNVYVDVMHKLDDEGIKWEVFTNGLPTDNAFAQQVIEAYGGQNVVFKIPNSAVELLNIVASYKVILGSRLHACISAYSIDIPIISFYWDDKMLFFAKMVDIEDQFCDESNLTSSALFEKIRKSYYSGYEYNVDIRNNYKSLTEKYLTDFLSNL